MKFVVEFICKEGGWIARIGELVSLKSITPIMALTNLVDEHEAEIISQSQQPSPAHSADNAKMWAEMAAAAVVKSEAAAQMSHRWRNEAREILKRMEQILIEMHGEKI